MTDGGPAGTELAAVVAAQKEIAAALGDGGTAAVAAGAPVKDLPVRVVEHERKQMKLRFSTEGGALISAELTGPREREPLPAHEHLGGVREAVRQEVPPPPQMDMAPAVAAVGNPFSVGLVGAAPIEPTQRYEVVEDTDSAITFRTTSAAWELDKRFSWQPDGFGLALDVTVKNVSSAPQAGELQVLLRRSIDPKSEEKSSLFGGIGNQATVHCLLGDKMETKKPSEDPAETLKGPVRMVGLDQQYFLSAIYPIEVPTQAEGACVMQATSTVRAASLDAPFNVAPGQSVTLKYGAFLGPKDFELLKTIDHGLEKTVDFGWWAVICKVLLVVLKFFHGVVGNWGAAIILLTVSAKLLLLPLTHKAMVSAESMKKLQPKMEEIKKKYPDDRERQNAEVMKLYQEAKVNPLGGCLPLLIQLPIWAALFTTLRTSYDLYGEPFIGPVWTDLTFKDPTYLLPLALGITMIITQRLQPQVMDKQQAFIFTWIMPVFFTGLMMNYPAGLSLYIFTNNLLSILQQFLLRKYLEKKGIATPRGGRGGGGGKLKDGGSSGGGSGPKLKELES